MDVLSFLQEKTKAKEVMDQIHAIWWVLLNLPWSGTTDNVFRFCFTPNVSRPLMGLEQRFFNEQVGGNSMVVCNLRIPHRDWPEHKVPVVAIFTNSTISSRKSMIRTKTRRRIYKSPVLPWRISSRSRLRLTSFHPAHMCDLNVYLVLSFSGRSWDLQHAQQSTRTKVIIRTKSENWLSRQRRRSTTWHWRSTSFGILS